MARLLVIDDNELVRTTIARMLTSDGHEVATADNGVSGLAVASEAVFDLVVVDILMPEKDGIETIMELRLDQPALKLIGISGGGHAGGLDFLEAALQLGADATLKKPIALNRLLTTFRDLLD